MDIIIMNTAEYLNTLIGCKEDMKAAIEERGITITGGLSTYADLINSLNGNYPVPNKFDKNTIFMGSKIVDMPFIDTTEWTSTSQMFEDVNTLQTVKLFDTSSVTDMSRMFLYCSSLTSIPLFNTSNVVDMSYMLNTCSLLTSIPLFNTSKVTTMHKAFGGTSITEIPQFDTSNVINMELTFAGCSKLITIPQMNAGKWKNVSEMFGEGCVSITNIGGFIGLGKEKDLVGTNTMFDWKDEVDLSRDQALNIINNLYDRTTANYSVLEIYIPSRNITEDDIAVATNKGWIVDYYD